MGLISGIIRLQFLKMRELELSNRIQTLTQTQAQLVDQSASMVSIASELDPGSPEARLLEARREKLVSMEKKLVAELTRQQNMLKMVETEIESAQQLVDKAIQRACRYSSGGGGG